MKGKGTYGKLKRYFSQECNCGTIIIESEGTITSNTEIPKPDIVLKEFWRKNEHFADLFNAFLFKGQQVLKAGDLEETDTDISGILKRNDLGKAYQKSLDVVKKTAHGVDFVILGLENQEKIHYAMPLRILQGDVMLYLQECKDIQKINGEQNQYSSADEYLSRFKKTDRLHPVITLCVYYGEKDWDGPRHLTDMLKIPEGYRTLVSDYKMNLLEIRKSDRLLFSDPDVENAFRLVRMIVRQIITRLTAVKCKLQKLHARITGILYELQYRRSQESKILCNNRTVAKPLLDRIHDIHARPRHPLAVCRRRIAVRDRKVLVKAAEMINPHDVIQLKACCQSLQPPLIAGFFMIIPAIQRIAPELAGRGKSIRRTACYR